jgi:hypothetical protein
MPPPEGRGTQLGLLCACGRRPIELKGLRCCRLCYYRQYDSLRWFGGLRELILKRDRFDFRACGAARRLVVHHRDERNAQPRRGRANHSAAGPAFFILLDSGLRPLHVISDSPEDLCYIIEQRASGHSNRSGDAGLGELFPLAGYRFDVCENKFAELHDHPPRSAPSVRY